MPKISAICLSDLHLGSETSVLTAVDPVTLKPDINRNSPVLVSLVACLKSILSHHEGAGKPRLVLAGDVLELALTTTNVAATVFTRFVQLLMDAAEPPLDPSIIFVPGNHDHHLWETARERHYGSYIRNDTPPLPLRHVPWHATHLFPWRKELKVKNRDVESFLLTTLLGYTEYNGDARILAMYPNFGVMSADGKSRCTVVHHGHFTESIYHLMTELRKFVFPGRKEYPEEIWDIEAENYAWIDFLWGTLGRSGEVGESMGQVYDMLKSKKATRRLIDNLARSIPERFGRSRWTRWIERIVIRLVLDRLLKGIGGLERGVPDWPLSESSEERLEQYIGHYVRGQLDRECKEGLPDHLNFIFGHTHKPYEEVLGVKGVDTPVHIYNAGGWVVDTPDTSPRQGGAIIMIDGDGNAASIRMYNQSDDASKYRVTVAKADRGGNTPNPLYDHLLDIINPDRPPWSEFSTRVTAAVEERRRNMREVIRRASA